MTTTVTRRTAVLIGAGGAALIVRYGLIQGTDWPHWLHHLLHLLAAWPLAAGAWTLAGTGTPRTFRVAAGCLAAWALSETVMFGAAGVWEGLLGRGAIPSGLHAIELLLYLAYVGALLIGIGLVRHRGLFRWAGVVLLAGLVADLVLVEWGAGAGFLAAAPLIAAAGRRVAEPVPVA